MRRTIIGLTIFSLFAISSLFMSAKANDDQDTTKKNNSANVSALTTKSGDPVKAPVPVGTNAAVESELQQLRDRVQTQSEELQELRVRLAALERKAGGADSAPASVAVESSSNVANATSAAAHPSVVSQSHAVAGASAEDQAEKPSPLSVKIGSAKFTPGGFLDMAMFFRSANLGSGIATSFGSVPFNNQLPQTALTETRFSAQYSRLSLKVDADLTKSTTMTGYVEADFLGFQPANALQTTNGNSPRLRLFFGDIKHGKWEFLGGQAWSLLTPNRAGLSPMPADVFVTLNEDPNFQVGLVWTRQPQFRVVYHPASYWAVGVSLENPQQFAPGSVVFPSAFFSSQFDNGSGSTSAPSSATNTAVPNLHPDIIVKTAFDWKPWGHGLHLEAAGLVRSFKVANNLTTPNSTNTITGGGGSVNLNFEVIKNLRLIANSFYSDGGGRYIFGLGPDAIVKPNGTLSAVHSGSGIGGFEWQTTPRYMLYGYYGGAYFQRNFGLLASTPTTSCAGVSGFSCVGFGFPGSATSSNRAIQEGTFGVIPTLWSSPNFGKVQIITQYSYLVRSPWSIPAATIGPNPKNAHLSMVYLDFRYTLP